MITVKEYVVVHESKYTCEIYCHDCSHLRLWLREELPPTCCKNCQSENTERGPVGSSKFTVLKGLS